MTDYVLALTALVEAEGRLLRRQIGRISVALVLLAVVGLLALAGFGLGLAGLYHALAPFWGVAGSLAAVAGLCLLIAAGLGFWAYRWLR